MGADLPPEDYALELAATDKIVMGNRVEI